MAWSQWFAKPLPDGVFRRVSEHDAEPCGLCRQNPQGAKPGDLPIDQPYLFRLSINPATARALGVMLSPSFVARVDDEIE
jgi:hypothetical protein